MTDPTAGDWAAVAGDPEDDVEWVGRVIARKAAGMGLMTEAEFMAAYQRDRRTKPPPRPADLRGLVPNMTGGLGAVEWVRRIRDYPDSSPAPSLRRWIVFVGIGLALAGLWLVWRMWS